jgi:hypothetical protein
MLWPWKHLLQEVVHMRTFCAKSFAYPRHSLSENRYKWQLSFREHVLAKAGFPRTHLSGSSVNRGNGTPNVSRRELLDGAKNGQNRYRA